MNLMHKTNILGGMVSNEKFPAFSLLFSNYSDDLNTPIGNSATSIILNPK